MNIQNTVDTEVKSLAWNMLSYEFNVVAETVPFSLFLTLHIASSEERNFECMFGNVTIYLANDRMCNGQKDCPDGSDEDDGCGVFSSCVHAGLCAIVFVRRM